MRVFISYSHDSAQHKDRVWDLCERLRNDGIDCRIDQHEFSPPEGWPRWCRNQLEECQFVLVVCTETYQRRYEGKAAPGEGKGVKWEGFIVTQDLYEADSKNVKFIPVVFNQDEAQHIPTELRGATRYDLSTLDEYDNLLRHLTNQPARVKSPVATQIRPMPPLERKQQFLEPPWNVPYSKNPFFTGRERILAQVEKELHASGRVALTGLGGVGKTQIATHFTHEHRDEYSAVLWASAASQEALVSDFAAIAGLLNLPEKDEKDQAAAVAAVKRWLAANGGWLLIFDDANDLAIVRGFLPQSRKGRVLLTTQAQATGDIQAIEILDMLPEDGATLLLRRGKIIKPDALPSATADATRDTAIRISTKLGGLPLALDQAGAYIDETRCGLAGYLDLYTKQAARLLRKRGATASEHLDSIATTVTLSFEKVAGAGPSAADLLRFCAFLHPEIIPDEIFTKGGAELGPSLSPIAADPLELNAACAEILKYSLIRRDADANTLGIHRLVQQVIQDDLTEVEKRQWAERAVRAVNEAFPSVEFANWAQCERLVPQALACEKLVEAYGFEFEAAGRLFNQAGHYLDERARFSQAEPLSQRALAIRERVEAPDYTDVAESLNNLALLYKNQGKYTQSEPLFQRALAICEKALGPDHPNVATSLNNLAVLYYEQGKYAEAESLYERALAITEKALGPEHPDVGIRLNNLAELYRAEGKYSLAEPLYQRAVTITEKAFGPEHPDVAVRLNNLAGLYRNQGKYAAAEPLYRRALAIWEKTLGPEHPNAATSLNNLALLYKKQGKYAKAEPLYQRAHNILEKAAGPEHPTVAASLNNLAGLYFDQGKFAEAEPLLKRALAIMEKALGPEHPDVAIGLNNLAEFYRAQGKYAQAEPLYQQALAILEKVFGPEHPDVGMALENYARLFREMKRGAAARDLEARARAIRAAHAQKNPPK